MSDILAILRAAYISEDVTAKDAAIVEAIGEIKRWRLAELEKPSPPPKPPGDKCVFEWLREEMNSCTDNDKRRRLVNVTRALVRADGAFKTVDDVRRASEAELLRLPWLGRISLGELRSRL